MNKVCTILFFSLTLLVSLSADEDKLNNLYNKVFIHSQELADHLEDSGFEKITISQLDLLSSFDSNKLDNIDFWPYNMLKIYSENLSLWQDSDSEKKLGLYYTNKHSNRMPYRKAFPNTTGNIKHYPSFDYKSFHNINNYGDLEIALFSKLNLSILELRDSLLLIDDFTHLSKFHTIKKLGLPARGVIFDKPFVFPENLDTLIVRNANLTNEFFNALSKLKKLKKLIIVDCSTSLNQLRISNFSIESDVSAITIVPFRGINESLTDLVILRSDPILFEYVVIEKWHNLANIQVDVYNRLFSIRTYLFPNQDDNRPFPKLKKFLIGVCPSAKVELTNLMDESLQVFPNLHIISEIYEMENF